MFCLEMQGLSKCIYSVSELPFGKVLGMEPQQVTAIPSLRPCLFFKSATPDFIVPARGRRESGISLLLLFFILRFLCTDVICGGGKGEQTNYSTLCSE